MSRNNKLESRLHAVSGITEQQMQANTSLHGEVASLGLESNRIGSQLQDLKGLQDGLERLARSRGLTLGDPSYEKSRAEEKSPELVLE